MKKLIALVIFLLMIFLPAFCNSSKFYIIRGFAPTLKDSTLVCNYYMVKDAEIWKEICDTAYVVNGEFEMKGNINELRSATLVINSTDRKEIEIYIEPAQINLLIDINQPFAKELSGTNIDNEYIDLKNTLSSVMKSHGVLGDSINHVMSLKFQHENEPLVVDSLMKIFSSLKTKLGQQYEKVSNLRLDFVKRYSEYKIIPDLLFSLAKSEIISTDSLYAIYNSLPKVSQVSFMGQLALKQITENERLSRYKDVLRVGDKAPDFLRVSMQGDSVQLSNFKNKKYVLLDFWASWCVNCIRNLPEVKKLYNLLSNNDLQIIGISSDDRREDWLSAVKKYRIERWPQIFSTNKSDESYFKEDDIGDEYNIQGIPTYILIDKQGRISAIWHKIGQEEASKIFKLLKGS